MKNATILITGASDGIGLALAHHYHTQGARVLVLGRRPVAALDARLHHDYCRVDLAQPFAAAIISAFLSQRQITGLNLLIHCAGIGSYGPVAQQQTAEIDALLHTNLYAPIVLTHALLPALKRARGQVVFIGSVAASMPTPDYAVYTATKAGLEGFARSLRVELGQQVRVQIVHPGATRTGMHAKIGAPLEAMGWQRFPLPEQVAKHIAHAIKRGKPIATVGLKNRVLRLAGRHLAGLVDRVAMQTKE